MINPFLYLGEGYEVPREVVQQGPRVRRGQEGEGGAGRKQYFSPGYFLFIFPGGDFPKIKSRYRIINIFL